MQSTPSFLPAFIAAVGVGNLGKIVGIESRQDELLITTKRGDQIKFPLSTAFHDGILAEVVNAPKQILLNLNAA